MLFARSWRRRPRRVKRMKNQHLAGSQVVVCKIHQPPLLVPQALLAAISFRLLRVVLAIFLPIVGVRLAPLPRTLQADLLIHRIGSDLLPMIIAAALALACRLSANPLLRMIRVRLKGLLTVTATALLHQAAPEKNGRGSFSLEAPLNLNASALKIQHIIENYDSPLLCRWCRCSFSPLSRDSMTPRTIGVLGPRKTSRLCGVVSSTESADLSARNRDGWVVGCGAPRNNTPCVISFTLCRA